MMPPHMTQECITVTLLDSVPVIQDKQSFVILLGEDKRFERNAVDVSGTPDKRESWETYSEMSSTEHETLPAVHIF